MRGCFGRRCWPIFFGLPIAAAVVLQRQSTFN
jgi:hypothetical protein